jgi:hypothetical protein
VALTAVLWMIFAVIILLFPTSPTPAAPDMNYSVAVTGGVIVLSLAYYYFPKYGGRYWFKGPVRTIAGSGTTTMVNGYSESKSSGVDLEKKHVSEEP